MVILYVLAFIAASLAIPSALGVWNAAARVRRAARFVLPVLLLAGCDAGGLLVAQEAGTDEPADAGADVSPDAEPCAEQDPACPTFPHAFVCPFYDGGPCQLGQCVAPWLDCNHDPADGCEVDTSSDPANCGACGVVCPVTVGSCKGGVCK